MVKARDKGKGKAVAAVPEEPVGLDGLHVRATPRWRFRNAYQARRENPRPREGREPTMGVVGLGWRVLCSMLLLLPPPPLLKRIPTQTVLARLPPRPGWRLRLLSLTNSSILSRCVACRGVLRCATACVRLRFATWGLARAGCRSGVQQGLHFFPAGVAVDGCRHGASAAVGPDWR